MKNGHHEVLHCYQHLKIEALMKWEYYKSRHHVSFLEICLYSQVIYLVEQQWMDSNCEVSVSVWSSFISEYSQMSGYMENWFSKLKVPDNAIEMEVTSECLDDCRYPDK